MQINLDLRPKVQLEICSHMVAATNIAKKIPVRRVLECGVGSVSTPWFLDRSFFPDLDCLLSYDTQQLWIGETERIISDKHRWFSRVVPSEEYMGTFNDSVDIMLVDSFSIDGRISILDQMQKKNNAKFIILHDSEHEVYNPVLFRFAYKYEFNYVPIRATVVSNTIDLNEFFGA